MIIEAVARICKNCHHFNKMDEDESTRGACFLTIEVVDCHGYSTCSAFEDRRLYQIMNARRTYPYETRS